MELFKLVFNYTRHEASRQLTLTSLWKYISLNSRHVYFSNQVNLDMKKPNGTQQKSLNIAYMCIISVIISKEFPLNFIRSRNIRILYPLTTEDTTNCY